jgi:hypothetical protein
MYFFLSSFTYVSVTQMLQRPIAERLLNIEWAAGEMEESGSGLICCSVCSE